MPKKSYKKSYKSKKPYRQSRLKTVKKMVGDAPETMVEKISRYGGALGTVAGTVARIMSMINVETKFFETSTSATAMGNTSGTAFNTTINQIAGGTAENQRIGEKVVNSNLIINYVAKIHASATATLAKLVVVYDKKPEIASAAWSAVMLADTPLSQLNKDNGDRFIILAVRTFPLGSTSSQTLCGKIYIPLNKVHSDWNSTTGSDFEKGEIKVMALSDEGTNQPTLAITTRLNYYDN